MIAKSPAQAPQTGRRLEQRLTAIPSARDRRRLDNEPAQEIVLPPLPGTAKRRHYGAYAWFSVCVLIPTIAAALYFWLVVADQYAAEFRFSVSSSAAPPMPAPSSLLTVLGGVTNSTSSDNYMVTDFITSPQAVQELQERIKVRNFYTKPTIDWWSRFDAKAPMESFIRHWQSMVTARFDIITGIATAEVRAFSPEDARLIANTLVDLSEQLINQIANRRAIDAVHTATKEVERAQDRLKVIRARLTAYRNKFGIIDPTTSVAASNSSLVQTLRANLAQLETQLETLKSQNLRPNTPTIVALNSQINSTREQLANTEAQVGRDASGANLSTTVAEYEQLNSELQYAQSAVTATMQALDQARANAAKQQLYITPYVLPSLPESARYPSRFFSTMTVAVMCFAFWIISVMIMRAIRERFG